MSPHIVDKEGFWVVGIATRTRNRDEMSGHGKIGPLWARFFSEGISARIPDRPHPDTILAVYTDYESDAQGEYSFVIGAEVTGTERVPPDLVAVRVPTSRYTVLLSETGPIPQIVIDLWKRVYSATPDQLGGARAYRADYEIHDRRAQNPASAQVELRLSIR